jgi:hypothetical protein
MSFRKRLKYTAGRAEMSRLRPWIVVSNITPKFVIIPGTVKEDYKDFSHHYKAHAKAIVPLILLCLIIAGIVSLL